MAGAYQDADRHEPDRSRTVTDFRAELDGRDLARHLALFYRSPETQLALAAAFVDHGLRSDRRCLYLVDSTPPERIEGALRSAGIDVDARVDAGDLLILDATDVYLDSGFDPEGMIATLEDACDDSVADGYDGLRVAGENSWCFHTDASFDHVLDFEAEFDAHAPDLPVTALCQYDLDRFNERSTAKALWTHEQIVYRNAICDNPYYISPERYRSTADPHLNARLMLDQTYDLARARRQIDRREQRLAVVNRVLRHDVRNDLNTVLGTLELLGESDRLDGTDRDRLATAMRCAEETVETAEKARYVQRTVERPGVERTALGPVVDRAVDEVAAAHPAATIDVSGPEDLSVLADTELDAALVEVLTNAIVHQDGDPPTASIAVSTPSPDVVRIDADNPGPPIPESDRRALREGTETPLAHGSGLGLWLVKWVVENAHGTLTFPAHEDDAYQIRVELPRVRE